MALTFEANYSKKLGLSGYSSSVHDHAEDRTGGSVPSGSRERTMYALLQASVDQELKPGFIPEVARNGNGNRNGNRERNGQSARPQNGTGNGNGDQWHCSPKQRQYILDLVDQHSLDKNWVEQLAQERFGKPVRQLNKLEASGLIEEIKEQTARPRQPQAA